jgi:hypothetical protein
VGTAADAIGDALEGMGRRIRAAIQGALGWLDDLADKVGDVLGAVGRLLGAIDRIHLPSLPHIPGFNLAPIPAFAGAPTSRSGGSSASSTAPVVVNVYGALDPEAVARQIRRLLADHDRRQGIAP